jgi:DNA-binding transcriptional ArsR family regulator
MSRSLPHPPIGQLHIAAVLHALSDPVRLAIVAELVRAGVALNCTQTAARLKLVMPKSTCSQHYRVLREAGVIACERHGVDLHSHVRRADLEARFPGLLESVLRAVDQEAPAA